jgi:hypothetical protein
VAFGVVCVGAGAAVALAATGDSWYGSGTIGSDGTAFYSATRADHGGAVEMQAFNKNSIAFSLTNAQSGATYTIAAKGRLFQSVDSDQEYPPFGFTATGATLKDAQGTTVCKNGKIVAGGFHNAIPRPPNPPVHDFVAEVTFASTCQPLPGHQYVEVWDLAPFSHYAQIWSQR